MATRIRPIDVGQAEALRVTAEARKLNAEAAKMELEHERLAEQKALPWYKRGKFLRYAGAALVSMPLVFFYMKEVAVPIIQRENIQLSIDLQKKEEEIRKSIGDLQLQIGSAQRERDEAKREKERVDVALQKAQEELVQVKASSGSVDRENVEQAARSASRDGYIELLEAQVEERDDIIKKVSQEIDRLRRELGEQSRARERVESILAATETKVGELSREREQLKSQQAQQERAAFEAKRCRQFAVIQKSNFKIPATEVGLAIGDMSDGKVATLRVLRNGERVEGATNVAVGQVINVAYEGVVMSLEFLSIEVRNLIPGISNDSGLLRVCTDSWQGES